MAHWLADYVKDVVYTVCRTSSVPLCARATYTEILVVIRQSAPSSVEIVRLLKELCTRKKGKAFNLLSLIKRVRPEIL